jgi:hypothetical protein
MYPDTIKHLTILGEDCSWEDYDNDVRITHLPPYLQTLIIEGSQQSVYQLTLCDLPNTLETLEISGLTELVHPLSRLPPEMIIDDMFRYEGDEKQDDINSIHQDISQIQSKMIKGSLGKCEICHSHAALPVKILCEYETDADDVYLFYYKNTHLCEE